MTVTPIGTYVFILKLHRLRHALNYESQFVFRFICFTFSLYLDNKIIFHRTILILYYYTNIVRDYFVIIIMIFLLFGNKRRLNTYIVFTHQTNRIRGVKRKIVITICDRSVV